MSPTIVVFGATGNQGGGVITSILGDPDLSKAYSIRAISRDPNSAASKRLKESGVAEITSANIDDAESVKAALKGAQAVFLPTNSVYDDQLRAREFRNGKTVADAAVEAGVTYFVYSTQVKANEYHKGKVAHVDHFDSKYDVEHYIRSLSPKLKSAFFAPGSFMQNYNTPAQAPQPLGDGSYALFNFVSPQTEVPLIDMSEAGKYIGRYLLEPEKYEGKVFYAASQVISYAEIAEIISEASGKKVMYQQIPREAYQGYMPKTMGEYMGGMWEWIDSYGYYGPETKERVRWTVENAKGKVSTLREYLEREPLKLA